MTKCNLDNILNVYGYYGTDVVMNIRLSKLGENGESKLSDGNFVHLLKRFSAEKGLKIYYEQISKGKTSN